MRLKYCIEDFIENIESGNKFSVEEMNQSELRDLLTKNEGEYGREFPMICYEHTEDSNEEVSIDETKFLNDKEHDGSWIIGEKYGDIAFILCLKEDGDELEIDTFEVASSERGKNISSYVIDSIEYSAEKYYESVYISPFDTNAMNFWKHQGYVEEFGGYFKKEFEGYDD